MMKTTIFTGLMLVSVLFNFSQAQNQKAKRSMVETISFGSCNKHDFPQPLWNPILRDSPDVWIWLGDNVYGDTHDMALLKSKYEAQSNITDYQKLKGSAQIIGVWDDHDYGINDGGVYYQKKKESQQILLDFLDEPATSPRRNQEGVYASYDYGIAENKIKVILLDTRYHRDTLLKEDKMYIPNLEGSLLGATQWAWLENELRTSDAAVHLIAGGIQFIPTEHPFEKWENFPKERERLLNLIASTGAKNPVLLSGDRHIAEVSLLKDDRFPAGLYEITSSGLTHSWREYREEYNPYRVGNMIANLHYGSVTFDWEERNMVFQIKGEQGQVYLEQKIQVQ